MFGFKCISSQMFSLFCGLFVLLNVNEIFAVTSAESWLMFARESKKILGKCYLNNAEWSDSWRCIKYNSLFLLDDISAADTIPLTNMVEFVRTPPPDSISISNFIRLVRTPTEYSPRNATASKDLKPRKYVEVAPKDFSWYDETIDRLNRIIETHGIRIALHSPVNEARGRRRQRMFPVMIFGMAVLGVIIVPIGFHIMTVISGTALLFAKMALLVASVTGSKRMVPHGVHYGVHQDHFYGPGPGWDRQEGYQQNNYRRN